MLIDLLTLILCSSENLRTFNITGHWPVKKKIAASGSIVLDIIFHTFKIASLLQKIE